MTENNQPPEIMRHFMVSYDPDAFPNITVDFMDLAETLWRRYTPSAELSTALRKLLEAKDAAERCQRMEQSG